MMDKHRSFWTGIEPTQSKKQSIARLEHIITCFTCHQTLFIITNEVISTLETELLSTTYLRDSNVQSHVLRVTGHRKLCTITQFILHL